MVTKEPTPLKAPVRSWLLLVYKVAPKPTARRVYVWRKLKRLGAILLHDSAWVLPDTPSTREQFQWIAAEIAEMGGEVLFWESRLAGGASDERLVRQLVAQTDAAYQALMNELKKKEPDLVALAQQYVQVKQSDYFQSELGIQVREALISARGGTNP